MFVLNGKRLYPGQTFEHNGVVYPANWLQMAPLVEKKALGIIELKEQQRPDDRFYFVSDEHFLLNGSYYKKPKELGQLKTQFINEIRDTANKLLQSTDWMIIRKIETGKEVPTDVSQFRSDVREYVISLQQNIENAQSVEELKDIIDTQYSDWPVYHQREKFSVDGKV